MTWGGCNGGNDEDNEDNDASDQVDDDDDDDDDDETTGTNFGERGTFQGQQKSDSQPDNSAFTIPLSSFFGIVESSRSSSLQGGRFIFKCL